MRFSKLFRRKPRQEEYVGRHRPGSWGEVALPPPLNIQPVARVTEPVDPILTTAPQQILPPPVVAEPAAAVPGAHVPVHASLPVGPPMEPEPAQAKVRLGFADGSSMDLSDDSGESDALRLTASRLLGTLD